MLSYAVIAAKIYFTTGLFFAIISAISFLVLYDTSDIDSFIESVDEVRPDRGEEIKNKIKKLREVHNIPEAILNLLPYFGIIINSFQSIFIWPWQLYNQIKKYEL